MRLIVCLLGIRQVLYEQIHAKDLPTPAYVQNLRHSI
jgi:hypothetical protein